MYLVPILLHLNVVSVDVLGTNILLHLNVVSVDVLGRVSVQTVDDELVWVHRSHQWVCCLKEIGNCPARKFTMPGRAILVNKSLVQHAFWGLERDHHRSGKDSQVTAEVRTELISSYKLITHSQPWGVDVTLLGS